MAWFDVGVNLLDPRYDIESVLDESLAHDVNAMCVISSDMNESAKAQCVCKQYNSSTEQTPLLVYTAGVHPHYADHAVVEDWAKLEALMADKYCVAVGECGLDFNRNFSTPSNQLSVFEAQLDIASQHNKGVYLHERDAFSEQVALLGRYVDKTKFAIAHCFTGNKEQLDEYLSLGCYVGITAWLCDEKRGADLRKAVAELPLSRLLLETDSPYLFPKTVRPRAKQNSPKYISAIAQELSKLTGHDEQTIRDAATGNAHRLFTQQIK